MAPWWAWCSRHMADPCGDVPWLWVPLVPSLPCGGLQDGRTAAILAASEGHVDCLKLLVEAGADLGATDKVHPRPLVVWDG